MSARLAVGKPARSDKQAITLAGPPVEETEDRQAVAADSEAAAQDITVPPAISPATKRRSFILFLAKLLVVVLAFRIFIAAPFSIPSESMEPTLMRGDFLIAAKWPYGWSRQSVPFNLPLMPGRIKPALPERGDVIIFRHPLDYTDYIKRAVGLPGDEVMLRAGRLYLNGVAVQQERLVEFDAAMGPDRYSRYRETLPNGRSYAVLDIGRTPQDDFGPIIVPPGKLFVLGDNRDMSADSRFPAAPGGGVGLVDQRQLVARAGLVAFSTHGTADWLRPSTWFTARRTERIGRVP